MNVYIGVLPETWRPKLLGGIAYFLKKRNIETDQWTTGTSQMFQVETVRIPIKSVNPTEDAAPDIHMSYSTFGTVMEALGMGQYFNDGVAHIPAKELVEKGRLFLTSQEKLNHWKNQKDGGKIINFAFQLYRMAKWAVEHGYDSLGGS